MSIVHSVPSIIPTAVLQGYRSCTNGDLEGYWKHTAPGPGCAVLFSISRLVVTGPSFDPNGSKLVDILKKMDMKLTGKTNGTLVIQPPLFKLIESILSITCPTNAPED
eukprot:scaffold164167_cov16-Tisochrysis_lutea.AAC.2